MLRAQNKEDTPFNIKRTDTKINKKKPRLTQKKAMLPLGQVRSEKAHWKAFTGREARTWEGSSGSD